MIGTVSKATLGKTSEGRGGAHNYVLFRARRYIPLTELNGYRPEAQARLDLFCFSVALRPQKPSGLLGTRSPGRSPRLSLYPAPEL